MTLIKIYLQYIQEKEWDEKTDNDDAFDQKVYSKVLGGPVSSIDPFNDIRHDADSNLFDIYIKNLLGDYKGRTDSHNMPVSVNPIGKDAEKKLQAVKDRYNKLKPKDDANDNARFKAKAKARRNPDDDWDLRDSANIGPDSDGDGVIDSMQAPGGDGSGGGE